ncbi:MAG: Na+/H+ antiporter NhaA [Cellulomonadaceae bacterium]|nr:Na+/H+ antiporter NhaA [Cellulomonadaceae bacterium]
MAGGAQHPTRQGRHAVTRGRRYLTAQVSEPLRRYLSTETGSTGLLIGAVVVAMAWANSPWSGAYEALWHTTAGVTLGSTELSMSLRHWVDDGLMIAFFFVIGLEVRREISVGELRDRRGLVVPAVAGVLGMALPAALFLLVNPTGEAARGWGVVIGTDTAFMLGALALVGPTFSTQLRIFLLTLTVLDDLIAVTVIGVAYSSSVDLAALALAGAGLVAVVGLGRAGVWRAGPYLVVVVLLWLATLRSGVHPSIAGMLAGLLVPAHPPRRGEVEGAASLVRAFRQSPLPSVGITAKQGLVRAIGVNERLQILLHPWTSTVVVPLFALANAGVDLRDGTLGDALRSPLTWGIVLGLVLGKTLGIGLGSLAAVRVGLGRLPQGVGPGQVMGGAALSGIGFTVSLLIAGLAFDLAAERDAATVGVLIAAVLATVLGAVLFKLAAVLRGERTAELPRVLDPAVDPLRDHVRGPVDAPVVLVEYLDFECPFCARATGAAREVRAHFGDDLLYVVRHLPLPDVHPHAELAARAAEAAAAQGSFWEMHDLLFAHQADLEADDLLGYAAELGLDVERFGVDLDDEGIASRIRQDVCGAEASGARGTPTFYVGGLRHTGPYDAASLVEALEASRRHDVLS